MSPAGRITVELLERGEPIDGLAVLAGAPLEECRARGARWTLLRVLERRMAIFTIVVVRRFTKMGLATAKGLVDGASAARVEALGTAIDARDSEAARRALGEWLGSDYDHVAERLATALLAAFSTPR
jgi:hypothetical protein